MGDKPIQAQRAINFLNSQSKMQLLFVGIQDRADLIMEEKKYIVKESLAKEVLVKPSFLKARVDQFKQAFKFLFDNGLPSFWNEEGIIIAEDDYLSVWNHKKNDTSLIDKLDPILMEIIFMMCWTNIFVCIMKPEELFPICHLLHIIFFHIWM